MQRYIVKPGVTRINGMRVPDDRIINLTEEQARYEFDQGKLELPATAPEKPPRKAEKKEE